MKRKGKSKRTKMKSEVKAEAIVRNQRNRRKLLARKGNGFLPLLGLE